MSVGFEPAKEVGARYEQAWLADAGGLSNFFSLRANAGHFSMWKWLW
jgi:hypothetical protein